MSSIKSPDDFNYSKEDMHSNQHQSFVYEAHNVNSPLGGFISQEVSASAGEGRGERSYGLNEFSQLTDDAAASSHLQNQHIVQSKVPSLYSNNVSNTTNSNAIQQFLMDKEGRQELRHNLSVRPGGGQPMLLTGVAESGAKGRSGQGQQTAS